MSFCKSHLAPSFPSVERTYVRNRFQLLQINQNVNGDDTLVISWPIKRLQTNFVLNPFISNREGRILFLLKTFSNCCRSPDWIPCWCRTFPSLYDTQKLSPKMDLIKMRSLRWSFHFGHSRKYIPPKIIYKTHNETTVHWFLSSEKDLRVITGCGMICLSICCSMFHEEVYRSYSIWVWPVCLFAFHGSIYDELLRLRFHFRL